MVQLSKIRVDKTVSRYNFLTSRDTLFFMKKTKCYLCRSNNYRLIIKKSKYEIVKCNNCDFIFTTPIPSKEQLDAFYDNFDYKDNLSAEKVIRSDAKRCLRKIDLYTNKKGKLLDIGCGRGYFLDEARTLGWDTYGVDTSRVVVDFAEKRLHLNVFNRDIFSFQSDRLFDLVTLNQVIEHFSNPENLINQCSKYLRNGGLMYIATPNTKSISARVLKDNFDHFTPPEHLSYFSKHTLQGLLQKQGFKVLYAGSWSYPADLGGIIKTFLGRKVRRVQDNNLHDKGSYIAEKNSNFPNVKQVKAFLFDRVFCHIFYKVLNFDSWGINLEVLAVKL